MADTKEQFPAQQLPFEQPQSAAEVLPSLNRYERLEMLEITEGFLPTSLREVSEATSLEAFKGHPGGTAKHLQEVTLRQKQTGMADPKRTGRRLTREYGSYAIDAKQRATAMGGLALKLQDDINPELKLDRVFESTAPGLLDFLQDFDLRELRETGRPDKIGYDPLKVNYTLDNHGIVFYLQEAMAVWRVQQLRKHLPGAIDRQVQRQIFWADRLEEVVKHYPDFRPIAKEQLAKLQAPLALE